MMQQANLLRLELKAPTRVQSLQKAAVPMKRESKKQLLGTAAAALIGFALVGLGVIGYESRVRRAMTVADVQKATLGPDPRGHPRGPHRHRPADRRSWPWPRRPSRRRGPT